MIFREQSRGINSRELESGTSFSAVNSRLKPRLHRSASQPLTVPTGSYRGPVLMGTGFQKHSFCNGLHTQGSFPRQLLFPTHLEMNTVEVVLNGKL